MKLCPVMAMGMGSFWTWLTLACNSGLRLSKLSSNSSQGGINKGDGTINPWLKLLKHLERTYLYRRKRHPEWCWDVEWVWKWKATLPPCWVGRYVCVKSVLLPLMVQATASTAYDMEEENLLRRLPMFVIKVITTKKIFWYSSAALSIGDLPLHHCVT